MTDADAVTPSSNTSERTIVPWTVIFFHVFSKELLTSHCKNTKSESLDPSIDFCMISHCLSKICIKIGPFHLFQHYFTTFTFILFARLTCYPQPISCRNVYFQEKLYQMENSLIEVVCISKKRKQHKTSRGNPHHGTSVFC